MNYYNQTDLQSVQAMEQELTENGFAVSISNAKYQIKRETSQYNKYMKWHLVIEFANGSKSSQYFKTRKQAIEHINSLRRPLPMGNGMSLAYYERRI